ncbi:hypothetical protein GL267_010165 [Acidithiobacillus ferrianus]|uniref:Lipoprotein n=2 Tax=Acidithiobacillus ferrianus TaxID=2678518 RepID=A0A845U9P3_9PROT|nr:hypothetical protein [Acidithiobacillus ferrianus]NDU42601.1 hypothetical protein [Acidithiobacillus ferrianus]
MKTNHYIRAIALFGTVAALSGCAYQYTSASLIGLRHPERFLLAVNKGFHRTEISDQAVASVSDMHKPKFVSAKEEYFLQSAPLVTGGVYSIFDVTLHLSNGATQKGSILLQYYDFGNERVKWVPQGGIDYPRLEAFLRQHGTGEKVAIYRKESQLYNHCIYRWGRRIDSLPHMNEVVPDSMGATIYNSKAAQINNEIERRYHVSTMPHCGSRPSNPMSNPPDGVNPKFSGKIMNEYDGPGSLPVLK